MTRSSSLLSLATKSLVSRRGTTALAMLAIALSVALFLGVEKIRIGARAGFENTISGTDLVVGGRTSPTNLMLYAVFRIGEPSNAMSWESFQAVRDNPAVAWAVPISLGDSHKNYRVMGTTPDYFKYYNYARDTGLSFAAGGPFEGTYDAVVGAEVARALGYQTGRKIAISHGLQSADFAEHEDHPFTIVGILKRTGTPVDRTVHVSLDGLEAMHAEDPMSMASIRPQRRSGMLASLEPEKDHDHDHHNHDDHGHGDHDHGEDEHDHDSHSHDAHDHGEDEHDHDGHSHDAHDHGEDEHDHDSHSHDAHDHGAHGHDGHDGHDHHDHAHLEPGFITAAFVGLKSRTTVLTVQRDVNTFTGEPLTAVIPGVALSQLWGAFSTAETALSTVGAFVVFTGLLAMVTALLTSLNERRREMAVLRAVGARPGHVSALLVGEAVLIAVAGAVAGFLIVYAGLNIAAPLIEARTGASLSKLGPTLYDLKIFAAIVAAGFALGLIPAWRAYAHSLADGLNMKL